MLALQGHYILHIMLLIAHGTRHLQRSLLLLHLADGHGRPGLVDLESKAFVNQLATLTFQVGHVMFIDMSVAELE